MPYKLRDTDHVPLITYKLEPTIRNKIFNHKETIANINIVEDNRITLPECECKNSKLADTDTGHILTGDLRFVEDLKLRKLFSKGPNFREPNKINFNRCKNAIETAIESCILSMANKYKIEKNCFNVWKNCIMEEITRRIKILKKTKFQPQLGKVLNDPNVINYLDHLKNKFVITPIDKANKNIAFICKRYYIERTLKEVGLTDKVSPTYKITTKNQEEIMFENQELCKMLKVKLSDEYNSIPNMYWIPKMHKNPIGARFIIASTNSSNKPLSKMISNVFKMIFKQIENFHNKSRFYSNYNLFWVLENSKPVIDMLDDINKKGKAKSIATYDFSTLYTNIPHTDLINKLNEIIDIVFAGGPNKHITVDEYGASWTNKVNSNKTTVLNKDTLKRITSHLIKESFFKVGNKVFKQHIGIPMGLDPSPFFANLYLHRYEHEFMIDTIKKQTKTALNFGGCARFIDDLCCLNDEGAFNVLRKKIYPEQLELKSENEGKQATFLDLQITIKNNKFEYCLFDKRDAFPFSVVRMPDRRSNIPKSIFYGSFSAELLRIARATLYREHFIKRIKELTNRMLNQGGNKTMLIKQINKVMHRHEQNFNKYKLNLTEMKEVLKM